MAKLVFHRLEKMAGKGENTGHQHFLHFPLCFKKFTFSESLKWCGKGLVLFIHITKSPPPHPEEKVVL